MDELPPWQRATAPAADLKPAKDGPWTKGAKRPAPTVEGQAKGVEVTVMLPADIGPEPSRDKKLKLEEFARQYIIDFNQTRAAARMGYAESASSKMGNSMFWEPYTQAYLVVLIRGIEERCIVGRNEVLAGLLREANHYGMDGNSATRIAAWREIGKIMGMYIARVEISANSSGVMEVPMARTTDEWEHNAARSQDALMEAVRA